MHCKGNVALLLFKDEVFRLQLHQSDVHILVLTWMTVIMLPTQEPINHFTHKQLFLETDISRSSLQDEDRWWLISCLSHCLLLRFVKCSARSQGEMSWDLETNKTTMKIVFIVEVEVAAWFYSYRLITKLYKKWWRLGLASWGQY